LAGLFHHEVDNLLAAAAALILIGLSPDEAVRVFENPIRLPHRLEVVATVRGVEYVNDSKATNTHSTLAALRSIAERRKGKESHGKTIWLVGGEAKGEVPVTLVEPARDAEVGLAICFGRDREVFAGDLGPALPLEVCLSLQEAFRTAVDRSEPGDIVVLSPAGASFDEFSSFEERGDRFRGWVMALEERKS
jgi:UDP-N-acetylmuramoylalanine--D-glutamate ligase